jgi:Cu2+-exporting ATPase
LIYYESTPLNDLLKAIKNVSIEDFPKRTEPLPTPIGWSYIMYQLLRLVIPAKLKPLYTIVSAVPYIMAAIKSIRAMKTGVTLLDAAAISAALLTKDTKAASTLMMLLRTGDYLEKWAKNRSRESLANAVSLNVGHVWILKNGREEQFPYSALVKGDEIVQRAGTVIPVDGSVTSGMAMVNEASMTGEPLSRQKTEGSTVHAGTVIEEGEIIVRVIEKGENTRYNKIIELIHESEGTKASVETKAGQFADKVVPFNFLLALIVYLLTKNTAKVSAALSVDYSCAIKLSTPLVFLAVMKEALGNGVFFKGGQAIEALSLADTIVFDKTGTLTAATPTVSKVISYNGLSERDVLKIAACLEEHFPHPVAKAVVKCAIENDVEHKEEHSKVEYIAAHGIATIHNGKHTVIGSRHFISEDEGIDISIAANDEQQAANDGNSVLYLAKDNKLCGLILIADPVREDAAEVIRMLRALGIKQFYMLTGDNARAAERVANSAGIDFFKGEALPHEKAEIIKTLKAKGYNVAMVGDGMNDSPALSHAHVGIAMKGGADLAEQVSDIALRSDNLYPLVIARIMSDVAMKRIKNNNVAAVGINTALMFMSLFGILTPQSSIWLHNLTTIAISINSMKNVLSK